MKKSFVTLLGGARVEQEGDVLESLLRRHQCLALLALLVLAPKNLATRDRVLALLWPETSARRGRNSLNFTLHVLRQHLGAEAIKSINDDLVLDTGLVVTDIDRFEEALANDDWAAVEAAYAGPFLDGVHLRSSAPFEEWVRTTRESLARRYRAALEAAAEQAEQSTDPQSAVVYWRRLWQQDPANSRVTMRLMRALEATGDRGTAISIAEEHAAILQDVYGADLDTEVQMLVHELRRNPNGSVAPDPLPNGNSVPARLRTIGSRRKAAVAVLVALTGVIAYALWPRSEATVRRSGTVLTAPFDNRSSDDRLDPLGIVAADWISNGLARTGVVPIATPAALLRGSDLRDSAGTPGPRSDLEIAADAGAEWMVSGSYRSEAQRLSIDARIVRVDTGEIVAAIGPLHGSSESPMETLDELRNRVIGMFASLADVKLASWAGRASAPPSYEAYAVFAQGIEDLLRRGRNGEAIETFVRAAELDPGFHSPLLWAVYGMRQAGQWARADSVLTSLNTVRAELEPWDLAMLDYHLALQDGDHDKAYRAMHRVVEIVPDSEWRFMLAQEAFLLHRPRESIRLLAEIESDRGWLSGRVWYWTLLTAAYHSVGDFERELQAVREARDRYPTIRYFQMLEARPRVALGEDDAALSIVDSLLVHDQALELLWHIASELRTHDRRSALREVLQKARPRLASDPDSHRDPHQLQARAWFFYVAGDLDAAWPYVKTLSEHRPDDPDFAGMRAAIDLHRGARNDTMETIDWLRERAGHPFNYHGQYRLWEARLTALIGESEAAVRLLHQARAEGYRPGITAFHTDPHFESLRDDPAFQEFLQPIG